jgi:AcrR family transcriptional regulator
MAERRRRDVAFAIEEAALALFAARSFLDVTVEEIAAAAGVGTRTVYVYFPAKEDILLAYPRRWAQHLADLVHARPDEESAFEAIRNSFANDDSDEAEAGRWMKALLHSDTRDRITRKALESIASALREAIAERAGRSVDDIAVQMAARMAADALDVGALRAAPNGLRDAVVAAWDVAGAGVAGLGPPSIRRRR